MPPRHTQVQGLGLQGLSLRVALTFKNKPQQGSIYQSSKRFCLTVGLLLGPKHALCEYMDLKRGELPSQEIWSILKPKPYSLGPKP